MPVLEALVAVGLAGNVVQFCETVAGVASQAVAIRRNGKPSSLQELREQGKKGLKLATVIMDQISSETELSEEDKYLLSLATECQKAGIDFLAYLDTFDTSSNQPETVSTVPGSGSGVQSLIQNAKTAVRFRWNNPRIMDFSAKLEKLRDVLILSTTLALRTSSKADNGTVVAHLRKIQSQADGNSALLQTLAMVFETESNSLRQVRDELRQITRECIDIITEIRGGLPQTRENEILRWLNFRQMTWRYEEVPPAFEKTFEWLYHDGAANPRVVWDSFKGQLKRGNVKEPYWINGKAGSGKSTLMKFIVNRPETHEALSEWAEADELLVVKFFFWNLGTPLQKNVLGMLRAILCSILETHTELIPVVFPALYQAQESLDAEGGPSYIELKKGLELLLKRSSPFLKICMFIDGIDELEGDHKDLSLFLRSLASDKVKLVVSSRPIGPCISGFEGCPTLQLQDLTVEDVELFVHANFCTSRRMVALCKRFPTEVQWLEREIRSMSSGVFLWVKIVVRILIDGLESGDTIADLRIKLRVLPPDLKDLYKRMLSKMSPEHQVQASEIFRLFHTWNSAIGKPFLALTLAFALDRPTDASGHGVQPLDEDTAVWKCENIQARVRSRCCGLVEVFSVVSSTPSRSQNTWLIREKSESDGATIAAADSETSDDEVLHEKSFQYLQYLHRTVAEFLLSDDVYSEICNLTAISRQDPIYSLAMACLEMLKAHETRDREGIVEWLYAITAFCRSPYLSGTKVDQVFSHADYLMGCHFEIVQKCGWRPWEESDVHWSAAIFPLKARIPRHRDQLLLQMNRYCVAAREGLIRFLKFSSHILEGLDFLCRYSIVLAAVESWSRIPDEGPVLIDASDTLSFLFQKVASPHDNAFGSSLWACALKVSEGLHSREYFVEAAELLRIFLFATRPVGRRIMLSSTTLNLTVPFGSWMGDPMRIIRDLRKRGRSKFPLELSRYQDLIRPRELCILADDLERLSQDGNLYKDVSPAFKSLVSKASASTSRTDSSEDPAFYANIEITQPMFARSTETRNTSRTDSSEDPTYYANIEITQPIFPRSPEIRNTGQGVWRDSPAIREQRIDLDGPYTRPSQYSTNRPLDGVTTRPSRHDRRSQNQAPGSVALPVSRKRSLS